MNISVIKCSPLMLILYLTLFASIIINNVLSDKNVVDKFGPCKCGIFPTTKLENNDPPLKSSSILNVTCNANGTANCHEVCVKLAQSTAEVATQYLCNILPDSDHLNASLYSKTCGNPWNYTGITSPTTCCAGDQPINCTST